MSINLTLAFILLKLFSENKTSWWWILAVMVVDFLFSWMKESLKYALEQHKAKQERIKLQQK